MPVECQDPCLTAGLVRVLDCGGQYADMSYMDAIEEPGRQKQRAFPGEQVAQRGYR